MSLTAKEMGTPFKGTPMAAKDKFPVTIDKRPVDGFFRRQLGEERMEPVRKIQHEDGDVMHDEERKDAFVDRIQFGETFTQSIESQMPSIDGPNEYVYAANATINEEEEDDCNTDERGQGINVQGLLPDQEVVFREPEYESEATIRGAALSTTQSTKRDKARPPSQERHSGTHERDANKTYKAQLRDRLACGPGPRHEEYKPAERSVSASTDLSRRSVVVKHFQTPERFISSRSLWSTPMNQHQQRSKPYVRPESEKANGHRHERRSHERGTVSGKRPDTHGISFNKDR